eukprot:366384-Chlamydomonas_euryale.AAC.5
MSSARHPQHTTTAAPAAWCERGSPLHATTTSPASRCTTLCTSRDACATHLQSIPAGAPHEHHIAPRCGCRVVSTFPGRKGEAPRFFTPTPPAYCVRCRSCVRRRPCMRGRHPGFIMRPAPRLAREAPKVCREAPLRYGCEGGLSVERRWSAHASS